ncbi:hypothetical protein EHN06_20015 [Marinobacter sp. NP-4(2019)]|uniref:hypothetical protein n=1 Tax=Marinobacter sp. NP-4(2019) TaxID=2488665 RepID=UPI000FC3E7F1|nr:hypothetical protein [Marinobacter sp. NP-4(2019)]AZT85652.1 hypothetical protein EHN06_20015 [Marinobacter sp. NP-4(2019)]
MIHRQRRKTGWGFGPALFFIIGFFSQANAEIQPFGRFENQIVSEPEPIRTTIKDWGKDFERGERQWSVNHLEAGVRKDGVELSVFARALVDLRMNDDAAEFYGRIARKEPLEVGESVPVRVRANGFVGQGLRLGYRHQAGSWSVTGGAALLKARYLMSGGLEGRFTATSESDYDFNARVDYVYYRDVIFKRPDVDEADGLGWSFDLAADWQPDENWAFSFRAEDLLARIRWDDAPFTEAAADTDQKRYDEDGYAVFEPLLSGREGYRNFTQHLDPQLRVDTSWLNGPWSAHLRGLYQFDQGLLGLGGGYQFGNGLAVRGLVWPELEAIGVELEYRRWQASIGADHLKWRDIQALTLAVSYGY